MKKWTAGGRLHLDVPTNAAEMPILLAALKKSPTGPWAYYVIINADRTHSAARRRSGDERTNLFSQTLTYLKPARTILADALAKTPGERTLQRNYDMLLGIIATAALESGRDLSEARAAALQMLASNTDPKSPEFGTIIYDANALLGRIAIREGDNAAAKRYLLGAGGTPGSPTLNSFGPRSFALARELAERGEGETVIAFLDLVARFWANPEQWKDSDSKELATSHRKKLDAWKQQIREGKIPTTPSWH